MKRLFLLVAIMFSQPVMADVIYTCGNGNADSTCIGGSTFNEAGWCQGGIFYQGQCMTPEQFCTSQGNIWYNGACISQATYCTSVLGEVWYNGSCITSAQYAQIQCTAAGNIWSNGTCINPATACTSQGFGYIWQNNSCTYNPCYPDPVYSWGGPTGYTCGYLGQ